MTFNHLAAVDADICFIFRLLMNTPRNWILSTLSHWQCDEYFFFLPHVNTGLSLSPYVRRKRKTRIKLSALSRCLDMCDIDTIYSISPQFWGVHWGLINSTKSWACWASASIMFSRMWIAMRLCIRTPVAVPIRHGSHFGNRFRRQRNFFCHFFW